MTSPPTKPEPRLSLGVALAKVDELKSTVTHLTGVIDTERETRRRFLLNLVAILVLSAVSLVGISFAYQAANDAKNVAELLEDCLVPGGECATRLAKQGRSGLARQMDFQICWASVPIVERSPKLLEGCRDKVLGEVEEDEGGVKK